MSVRPAIKREYLDFLDSENVASRINEMIKNKGTRLVANVNDLRTFKAERAMRLLETPLDEILDFTAALRDSVTQTNPIYGKSVQNKLQVGLEGNFGAHHVSPRGLAAHLIGRMVCVEGIVSRCSLVNPKLVRSVHYCPKTSQTTTRDYRDATSLDGEPTPTAYPKTDETGNEYVTEYGLSIFKNHQTLTIQEMPERAPTGQLPRSVQVIVDDDLVDNCKPGDRVMIVGIFRAMAGKSQGVAFSRFNTVILANNVKLLTKEAMMPPMSEGDIKHIMSIARNKKVSAFELIAKSLAPSIYGHEHIKKGILLLLLGGVEHNLNRGGHIRGDINILLVGDPSCGKSQMLRFVQNIAPHCITTTGRGASGVGLTAAVTTDQETGERRLDAGAMVLGDGGIVCVDEFDKMSDLDRVSLHEVMEQQTVTIAKAGIHTSLNARCSVLAAANPVYGQYDPYQGPMANIGLPDSLLSRFDLLFIVLDKMGSEADQLLSLHVLQSYMYRRPGEPDGTALRIEPSTQVIIPDSERVADLETPVYVTGTGVQQGEKMLSVEFVRKYIMLAKMRCRPVLTNEASAYIANAYASLRSLEGDSKTLPVTARTLETMIRLSTAHAKCRFSPHVTQDDAAKAMDLIRFAYYNEAEPLAERKPKKKGNDKYGGKDGKDDDDDDDDNGGDYIESDNDGDNDKPTPQSSSRRTRAGNNNNNNNNNNSAGAMAVDSQGGDDVAKSGRTRKATSSIEGTPKRTRSSGQSIASPGVTAKSPTSGKAAGRKQREEKEIEDDYDMVEGEGKEEKEEKEVKQPKPQQVMLPSVKVTKEMRAEMRTIVRSFASNGVTTRATVLAEIAKRGRWDVPTADYLLFEMSEANEVMVTDEQIFML